MSVADHIFPRLFSYTDPNSFVNRCRRKRGDFDIVVSNSVIEHVGTDQDQASMASGIARLCDCYVIQTSSFWFPFESHAQLPLFQFLPPAFAALLILLFRIRGFPRGQDFASCVASFKKTRMLTKRRFQALFPDAEIQTEWLMDMPKSYIAVHGFEEMSSTADAT